MSNLTNFNDDLSVQAGGHRFVVKEFLPSGVPVYEEQNYPELKNRGLYRWNDGNQSLWYPQARLFRQKAPGDWGGVMDAVEAALADEA